MGSFIAAGKSPKEVMEQINENDFFDFAKVTIPDRGLFTLDNMTENLERSLGVKTFEELKIPFYVGAANLEKARMEYFNQGELIKIIQASSSIPVLFSPVKILLYIYICIRPASQVLSVSTVHAVCHHCPARPLPPDRSRQYRNTSDGSPR